MDYKCECGYCGQLQPTVTCPECRTINDVWLTSEQPPINHQVQLVEQHIKHIRERTASGIAEYGVSMDRTDLSVDEWLDHAYEEAIDFALYILKIKQLKQ